MTAQRERSRSLPRNRRCLVLNADYRPLWTHPLSTKSVRKAVENVLDGKADILEDWGEAFRSPSVSVPMPKIIVLREYAQVFGEPKFCRASIYLRDHYQCQYCGEQFGRADLTFDHVIPKSQGGKTVWTNVVTCCSRCNEIKRDSLPNYSARKRQRQRGQMRPLRPPRVPTTAELLRAGLEFLPNDERDDFGSFLYWMAPLKP